MMLGLVELLLGTFVVSQMSQLRLLGLWPSLSDFLSWSPSLCPSCGGASIQGLLREARSISSFLGVMNNVMLDTEVQNITCDSGGPQHSISAVQCVTVTDSSTWDIWSSGVVISSFPLP